MTTGDQVAGAGAGEFADAWRALRADETIQFAPVEQPPAEPPPQWWIDFLDWLERALQPVNETLAAVGRMLGMSGPALMWIVLALAAGLVGLVVWRRIRLRQRPREDEAAVPEWTPGPDDARDLLEDADRLAAEGRFDEATHLLLQRSVGQIIAARPGLLEPSTTAREIAEMPTLPEAARGAFAIIAGRVERSLFALRRLSQEDWQAARAAYADFALSGPGRA